VFPKGTEIVETLMMYHSERLGKIVGLNMKLIRV